MSASDAALPGDSLTREVCGVAPQYETGKYVQPSHNLVHVAPDLLKLFVRFSDAGERL